MTLFTFLEQRYGELLATTLRHTCSPLNVFSATKYSNIITEEIGKRLMVTVLV